MIWQWPDDLRRVFGERNSASEVYYDNLLWHTGLTAIQSNRQQDNNYKTHTHYYKEKTNKPTHTHTHTHTDTETPLSVSCMHTHTHSHTPPLSLSCCLYVRLVSRLLAPTSDLSPCHFNYSPSNLSGGILGEHRSAK